MVDPGKVFDIVKDARERRTAPLILELDLTDGLVEGAPPDPLAALLSMRKPHLRDVIDGLRRARSDSRVTALVAKIGGGVGLARAQELRDAIAAFREAGKLTVAWAETFGETGSGTVGYYLATAFEKIYLQPSGDVGLTGVALSEPFFKGALDKVGVQPSFVKRHEYKTAPNSFTESGYTPEHEEASRGLITSLAGQIVEGVAAARGIPAETVQELIDRGPLLGTEALEAGLVDTLGYRDEVYKAVRRQAGETALLRYLTRYNRSHALRRPRLPGTGAQDVVALIQGHGAIRLGRSGRSPLPGQGSSAIGSDTLAAAIRGAVKDDRAKVIVFRINSPGGSYVASDVIWREVMLAREAGKPVIVSMGNVAASGGYFVAMGADTIVAQPGTITGSIGVFVGKPVVAGLLDRIGITMGTVENGAHAQMFTTTRDFSGSELDRINTMLDRIYDDFTGKAALGRNLPRERVHELARGRVWTGADAKENGLVDELGGLDLAIELARKKAGLPDDAPIRSYPHTTPLERLRPAESSEDRTAARARLEAWGPLSGLAARIGLPVGGPLLLPGGWDLR
jgi:protease-4